MYFNNKQRKNIYRYGNYKKNEDTAPHTSPTKPAITNMMIKLLYYRSYINALLMTIIYSDRS